MATEAAWLNQEQTHGKKKEKVCLDINRPSHGRTWEAPLNERDRRDHDLAALP